MPSDLDIQPVVNAIYDELANSPTPSNLDIRPGLNAVLDIIATSSGIPTVTIQDNGVDVTPYRNKLNFIGTTIVDNPSNSTTDITITGGGGGATNLSYTPNITQGTINSSTGTGATIPATDGTNAGLFLPSEKSKLAGIEIGAEVNVNADWNAISGDSQILNKPTIITDHTALLNIGSNTHAQIDTHIADTSNPHAVTKTQVGLSNVVNTDTTTTSNIVDSTNKRFITDAQQTVLGNTSGTNTGDQNLFSTIAVSGQSNVVADTVSDTLTLVAGSNITITTDALTDTITIASSGGSGGITIQQSAIISHFL